VLLGASITLNVGYQLTKPDLLSRIVWAPVAAGASIGAALAMPALLKSLGARQWAAAAASLVALILFGTFSIVSAIGNASGGRVDAATAEQTAAGTRARLEERYRGAKAELDNLKPSRPLAELDGLVASTPTVCTRAPRGGFRERVGNKIVTRALTYEEVCSKDADLLAEHGRAKRRQELQAQIERLSAELAAPSGVVRQANADTRAIVAYLSAIGWDLDAQRVDRLLVLLAVALVELGSGLATSLALALAAAPESGPQAPAFGVSGHPDTARTTLADAAPDALDAHPDAGRTLPDTRTTRPLIVVHASPLEDWLRSQGGSAHVSMRALGAALRCSPSAAHDAVRRAASAGIVRATPSARGTVLELVARVN
jgi:hypothetical protein